MIKKMYTIELEFYSGKKGEKMKEVFNENESNDNNKCDYCDGAYKSRHYIGFNFESAKFCPMCGRKFKEGGK